MRRIERLACLAVVVLLASLASGCGPYRTFRLPLSSAEARGTFSPIASVAGARGLRVAEFDTSVNVQLDDATWVYFRTWEEKYQMTITLDGKKVPEAEQQAKFAWAKQEADAIFNEAMAIRQRLMPAPVQYAPAPVQPPGVRIDVNVR